MCQFTHLHNHTEFDIFDADSKLEQLYNKAKRDKMISVATTGHHNVWAWFNQNHLSKQYRIKPIFGMELNVEKNHLTVLAENEKGVKSLIHLNNLGYRRKGRNYVTEQELFQYSDGLIVLSGCTKGKVPQLLINQQFNELANTVEHYKKQFKNRYFIEVQNYHLSTQYGMLKALMTVANKKDILVIPTNDCHYVDKEDHLFQKKLVQMHTNGNIVPQNHNNYFKTKEEMKKIFSENLLNNTQIVDRMCQADFEYFITQQQGTHEIPLSMIYRYDDAEALKKALYSRKEYRLGEFMYKKMKKEGLKLEDLYENGNLKDDIKFAYGLRGRIYKIEPDPYYFIKVTEDFPIYRKNKETPFSAQMEMFTAYETGFEVYDKRKTKIFMTK